MKSLSITDCLKYLAAIAVASQVMACTAVETSACLDNSDGCSVTATLDNINTGTDTEINNDLTTGSFSVVWVPPSARDNGESLSLSEIASFRIYYGTSPGVYQNHMEIDNAGTNQTTMNNMNSGTYYLVVTTIDTDGRESGYSDEMMVTI